MIDSDADDTPDLSALLKRHAELETLFGDGDGGRFLSGWQCENPWNETLRNRITTIRAMLPDDRYQYFSDDNALIADSFMEFHRNVDRKIPSAILCGEGASSLIFTACAWLKTKGIEEVHYIPPLYFTAHFALKLLGIRARAVSGRHAFEHGFTMNLPPANTVLMLSDPVWYAGVKVKRSVVERIIDWQRETGSFVFVDGSFQYMEWNSTPYESTAELDPCRTIRIICPTKTLALHGYRFAYATLPKELLGDFSHYYGSVYGSASAESIAFARVAAAAVHEHKITSGLVGIASERYGQMRTTGKISADWQAECGYFVFEKIIAELPQDLMLMNGSFFEQRRFHDHYRINLLSPSIGLLG
jgi:histidinol-phosphate/aromatic aminotransferase/cobyric acid decarboxylase-like protein